MAKATSIMSDCIYRLNESDLVEKAIQMFNEHKIHHLPVFLDKQLTGMLSSRDLIGAERKEPISNIMSEPLIYTKEDNSLNDIVTTMIEKRINALPVLNDQNELVGIISSTDILVHYKNMSDQL